MARNVGTLEEWLRFFDTRDPDEACKWLADYSRQLDVAYDDLSRVVVKLYDSPTGDVAEVVLISRTALAEAASMLDQVRARFEDARSSTA